jgi:paraquat-inducible protein A
MSSSIENAVACPDCDLLMRIPEVPPGGKARCSRCGCTIAFSKPGSLDRTLALAIAAAIIFVIANVEPLMGLSVAGRQTSTTILGGVLEMRMQGYGIPAILVAFCVIVAPVAHIACMLAILLAVRQPPAPSWAGTLMRMLAFNQPWAMVEVMLLGILVALVKIADLATVVPGIGMFATGALIALIAAMTVSFDPHEAWTRIRWADEEKRPASAAPSALDPGRTGP